MVASVAVLSDIHGVLPVLDAILAHPAVQAAELIVVTGDHAAGPQPVAVLDRLTELGERVVLVRGNADRDMAAIARGDDDVEIVDDVTPWAAAQLPPAHVDLLAGLPHPVRIDVDGFGPVVFCHGTPRDDEEVVLVDSSLARWAEVFEDLDDTERTVVCGHTHMQFQRYVDRRLVINPGSVGMPYGRAGGHFAVLADGTASLHRIDIDVDAVCAEIIATSDFPDCVEWVDYFVRARASDAEALTTFAPRDGRAS